MRKVSVIIIVILVFLMFGGFFADTVCACEGLQFSVDKGKLAKSLADFISGNSGYYWIGYVTPSGLCTLEEVWISPEGEIIKLEDMGGICDFGLGGSIIEPTVEPLNTKYMALVLRREILRRYLEGRDDAFGEWKYEVRDFYNPSIKLVISLEIRPGLPKLPPSSKIEEIIRKDKAEEFWVPFSSWDSPNSQVAYIVDKGPGYEDVYYNCPGVENIEKEFKGISYVVELVDPNGVVYDKTSFIGRSSGVSLKVPDTSRPGYWRIIIYPEGYKKYSRSVEFYVSPKKTKAVNIQAICGPASIAGLALLPLGILGVRKRRNR